MSGTDRRTVLVWLGAGALRPLRMTAAAQAPQFFSEPQFRLVETLCELILPADAHSPGAGQAGVARYIDFVLANSADAAQTACKQELAAFEAFARQQSGTGFLEAKPASRAQVLDRLARAAGEPHTAAEKFFARMREMTIFGYYTSEIGLLKELEYKGNQVLGAFPGCEHR